MVAQKKGCGSYASRLLFSVLCCLDDKRTTSIHGEGRRIHVNLTVVVEDVSFFACSISSANINRWKQWGCLLGD